MTAALPNIQPPALAARYPERFAREQAAPGTVLELPVVPSEPQQLPQLGIVRIGGVATIAQLSADQVPWVNKSLNVPLRKIDLVRQQSFLLGSIVSGSKSLVKLAERVSDADADQAQQALFTSLPDWLKGYDMPAIDPVHSRLSAYGLYKACRGRRDPARLYFMRLPETDGLPVILRVGIARHKDQPRALAIMTRLGQKQYTER